MTYRIPKSNYCHLKYLTNFYFKSEQLMAISNATSHNKQFNDYTICVLKENVSEICFYIIIFRRPNLNLVQRLPLNRITLGQHKSDNNNQMIRFTDLFCVLFRFNGTSKYLMTICG